MSLKIKGKNSPEVLDFFCECGEAECGVTSSMNAKENGSFIACLEDRGALNKKKRTSDR